MSLHRRLAWSTSLHQLRTADQPAAPALVEAGRFNLRAIMQLAVSIARRFGSSCQLDWRGRMRIGLRTAWQRAREAMAAAAAPVRPIQAVRPSTARPSGFLATADRFSRRGVSVPAGVAL